MKVLPGTSRFIKGVSPRYIQGKYGIGYSTPHGGCRHGSQRGQQTFQLSFVTEQQNNVKNSKTATETSGVTSLVFYQMINCCDFCFDFSISKIKIPKNRFVWVCLCVFKTKNRKLKTPNIVFWFQYMPNTNQTDQTQINSKISILAIPLKPD